MTNWLEPVSMVGTDVTVSPLTVGHRVDLEKAAADGELNRLWYTSIPKPDGIIAEIERRLQLQAAGSMLPFAIISNASKKAVGMTTYMNIDADNLRLEIGSTWLQKSVQRSSYNTECKLLLLRHAFEKLSCNAVEFRTHFINHQSRRAIERLGAKFDGILRSHMVMENGTVRDTAVYSIISSEWPTVKINLMWQLEKPRDQ